MTTSRCETKTFTMSQLLEKFSAGEISKPKIQRSACWEYHHHEEKTNCQDFIKFIVENKNLINPLIFVEREYDNKSRLFTIDGNNRINAIVKFMQRPFDMFPELIDECFNEHSKKFIKEKSMEEIMRRAVSELFTDKKLLESNYNKTYDASDVSERFTIMKDKLADMKFMEIIVPITQFQNIDEEKIVSIYAGLNRNGVKLTEQDILASTASFIKFSETDLSYFTTLKANLIDFYNDINSKEVLKVDFDEPMLNLFEVLNGLQIEIYKQFKYVPAKPTTTTKYDLAFTWYQKLYRGFVKISGVEMNEFVEKTLSILRTIQEINTELYGSNIKCSSLTNYIVLPRTFITILYLYMYKYYENKDEIKKTVKNCIVYYEIWSLLAAGNKKNEYKALDPIKISMRKFNENYIITPCSINVMREIIEYQMKASMKTTLEAPKNRRKLNKLYSMLLTCYFNKEMPFKTKQLTTEAEHIIPFSSKWKPDALDIDRLGNLTLLDSELNKKRGNGRIMDTYIKENNLEYLLYPDEYKYGCIADDKRNVLSVKEYNLMCTEREEFLIDFFLKDLF